MFKLFNKNVKNLRPDEFKNEMTGEFVLIDVRTKDEFKMGHIDKAVNIPIDRISTKIGDIRKYSGKKLLIYCLSGARSSSAAAFLDNAGLEGIYNLSGGISAWNRTFA
jgi:rhodanese-related sulfurtransferase